MKLLYITYIDFDGKGKSGSSVRPQKMYKAFLQMGLDVKLLECQQNKFKERRKRVKEILHWLDNNTPDLCYIESPSGPIFNQIDLKLIKKVHDMGVPIGYFLRDAFWKFPILQKNISFVKKEIINAMCKRDLHLLMKNCDIIYFPTKSFAGLFNLKKIKHWDALPPAVDVEESLIEVHSKDLKRNCIYVGAVSKLDGTIELLKAFKKLNNEGCNISLILVCRENEWNKLNAEFKLNEIIDSKWLKVVHTSGSELKQYYDLADVALFPRQSTLALEVAMPVKLFEYLSYYKPIISTKRTEVKNFIEKNHCGIVCDDDSASIAKAIEEFYANSTLRADLQKNVVETAMRNKWVDRAQKVINDVLGL